MKVSINNLGRMSIKAESHIEAYALKKWTEENTNRKINEILCDWGTSNFVLNEDENKNKG